MFCSNKKIFILYLFVFSHFLIFAKNKIIMALNCDIIGLTNTGKTAIFNCISNICVIEDEESPFKIAEKLNNICKLYDIPYAYKGSYRKANRSHLDSFM